jgi:hypothetical protein
LGAQPRRPSRGRAARPGDAMAGCRRHSLLGATDPRQPRESPTGGTCIGTATACSSGREARGCSAGAHQQPSACRLAGPRRGRHSGIDLLGLLAGGRSEARRRKHQTGRTDA